MAEQLLGFRRINEGYLTAMNMKEARKDVATSLISNSGFIYLPFQLLKYSNFLVLLTFSF